MPKVFIYNGKGTGNFTVADSKALFETETVIKNADVTYSDFKFNLSGLEGEYPVFVVPGGSVFGMLHDLLPSLDKIKSELRDEYNYVGFCAGAYLAADFMKLSSLKRTYADQCPQLLTSEYDWSSHILPLTAIGPFYTNSKITQTYPSQKDKNIKYYPEVAKMKFSDGTIAHGLYLVGCGMVHENAGGFEHKPKSGFDIIANYQGEDEYHFEYKGSLFNKSTFPLTYDAAKLD